MNFDKLDNLVYGILKNTFGEKCERRDYRKLEKNKPDFFKGYGENSGLMFLVEVDYYHYFDVNLYEKRDSAIVLFRRDDTKIIEKTVPLVTLEKYLQDTLVLINEYMDLMDKLGDFNRSKITEDIIITEQRNYRIKELLK